MFVLLDTERMHAHRVFYIHVMVFRFSTMYVGLYFEHVTGIWHRMDSRVNVCKKSFVLMEFRN